MAPPLAGGSVILSADGRIGLMKRVLCLLLVVTMPLGGVLAEAPKAKNAKATLVYQHELPNVPGKSNRPSSSRYSWWTRMKRN